MMMGGWFVATAIGKQIGFNTRAHVESSPSLCMGNSHGDMFVGSFVHILHSKETQQSKLKA